MAGMTAGIILLISLVLIPGLAQAQGPSLAMKQLWSTGRDLAPLLGVAVTLRPPGSGVAVSGEWSVGRGPLVSSCNIIPDCGREPTRPDLRLLAGSVGYSSRFAERLGIDFYVRPAAGVTNIKRGGAGKSFLTLSGEVEASRRLSEEGRFRALVGFGASGAFPFKTERCEDCLLPDYEEGFSSAALFLGLMMEIR
jgi:hypothetical protein